MHAESGVSRCVLVTTVAVMTLGAYSAPVIVHAQSSAEFVPVTDGILQNPAPEVWLMWRRTLDSWGYSPLDPIRHAVPRDET